ncbi:AAA family ATPase [Streptosporangium subroseum]|uniref:AAA family ATPase n=1 Tax=Streptosporangium subroseum TaxID=106412 RepID=UPI00341F8A31
MVGSETTRLIVVRGNSGSGKSTIAERVRSRHGRGMALVGQDTIRRMILKERDVPGAPNIGLIDVVARYALSQGYHVIIEGIFYTSHYGAMLRALREDHRGSSHFYHLDVSFDETLRRHATKAQALQYGEPQMRQWYRRLDLLDGGYEHIVSEDSRRRRPEAARASRSWPAPRQSGDLR